MFKTFVKGVREKMGGGEKRDQFLNSQSMTNCKLFVIYIY